MTGQGPGPSAPDRLKLVGTVLAGRYRVLDVLGQGAMGAVYLGEHIKMGRKTALKILYAADHDPGSVARFARGAQNAARIDHPNVCRVFDFGDPPGGLHFLAMEFVEGESLFDVLRAEGRLAPERAVSIVAQTASGLHAAHELGIVHRDLKPSNIMITRAADGSDHVKVVDFDIAKEITPQREQEVTTHGWLVGTPEYMSPEQFMGGALDGRSDLYSLGIILFRLLTGRFPFSATTPRDIMMERLSAEPRTLQEMTGETFPPGLQSAVDGALRIAPDERWATASDFAHAVLQALGSPGAQARDAAMPLAGHPRTHGPPSPAARAPSPSAPDSPVPQRVPATMVSAGATTGTTHPAARSNTRARRRGSRAMQVGVAALAAVAAGLAVRALVVPGPSLPSSGDAEAAAPGGNGAALDSVRQLSHDGAREEALAEGPGDGDETETRTGDLASEDPVPGRPGTVENAGDVRSGGGTSTDVEGTPPPPDPYAGGAADPAPLTVAEARRILTGFEDGFVELVLVGVPDSVAADAAEQAMRIFSAFQGRGEAPVQSQAAFVLSKALYYRGRGEEALEWARRAWDLQPVESRRLWLERLRGSAPDPESPG